MAESTAKWLVTTVTAYILIGLFIASSLADPLIVLDPAVSMGLLLAGLAALGIQGVASYQAVKANQTSASHRK